MCENINMTCMFLILINMHYIVRNFKLKGEKNTGKNKRGSPSSRYIVDVDESRRCPVASRLELGRNAARREPSSLVWTACAGVRGVAMPPGALDTAMPGPAAAAHWLRGVCLGRMPDIN